MKILRSTVDRAALARALTQQFEALPVRSDVRDDEITSIQYAQAEGVSVTTAKYRLARMLEQDLAEVRWAGHDSHKTKAYRMKEAP